MCVMIAYTCSTPIPGLPSHWHSSESLVVFASVVGGDDSTVVGILQRSPGSGESVVERLQSRSVSEGQGMSYSISCNCHNTHIQS